ncbi:MULTISPECIES: 3'(2'),5'-bisphosphate nucleotidase CysQ [Prochlorococcus]|uniref:3'(2'),5'-bisphosphate nucleotidase n=1 Tax=Prochlorococcus marinus str. MIT 9116 TaxID=167544 RepID=A0A0A1ZUE9_PROMR|nr:3'(2'),5'-bisphosphate nucleotidase CysQ [Prochlorococcus marinus]KGF91943.1 3'(2'),5'-bisphosphate nucleotidase [Prochlorococcus marinus str. MIT 9107]KGF93030.1 3'(2'),5'-bisphosphate nucleotidase [Prochlorococcus marinus str. MIT 9116]KGF94012.1 3'(2'),5'-bisphosphate nucleotidase [Prochlorococcus marinus str. MIT 9123]
MIKLPSGVEIKDLIDDLKLFSWEASEILLYYSQILKDSSNKSNIIKNNNIEDPVTLADLNVNKLIIQRINEKYKDIGWKILSEENVKMESGYCDLNSDWVWVLDPLDGTKDFIQGTENYAMHLALNYKQSPYLGVVLIPERDELWIADGEKVWCENRGSQKVISCNSISKDLKEMVIVTSKNHRNLNLNKLIKKVGFKEVKIMGSIGCKIASIIRGESDIYICLSLPDRSSPKDWDFSAPEAILKAAGGAITNLENKSLSYGKKDFAQEGIIIASNNKLTHKKVCFEIRQIIKRYDLYPL